jgi:hypothetical protein
MDSGSRRWIGDDELVADQPVAGRDPDDDVLGSHVRRRRRATCRRPSEDVVGDLGPDGVVDRALDAPDGHISEAVCPGDGVEHGPRRPDDRCGSWGEALRQRLGGAEAGVAGDGAHDGTARETGPPDLGGPPGDGELVSRRWR